MRQILIMLAIGLGTASAALAQQPKLLLPNAPDISLGQSSHSPKDPITATLAWDMPEAASAAQGNPSVAGDVSLYTAVDLALRNSKAVQIAEADQRRTLAVGKQTRDVYIPSLSVGSGLGYSYGFPLGNPTLFNVQSTFMLFSFSQRDYIRSARAATRAATLSLQNARRQVILDTSLNYIQLSKTLSEIQALQQAFDQADKLVSVMEDRLQAGLESQMNLTQAKLTRAQIALQKIQLEDEAGELRAHLSGLTGLDDSALTPMASSVPPFPTLNLQGLKSAEDQSPAVQAAFAKADAKMFSAWGDKKANNRPIILGAFQYSRFATFNGYQNYYLAFQKNNIAVGLQATWPLFDRAKHDASKESAAIAARERRTAELAKIENSEKDLALLHNLRELEAQEQVADLQQQLAQDTLNSLVTRMNQGATSANGAPVTPQETIQQRIEERTRYVQLRDAQFNVTKVKLDLLSALGGLEDWAKQSTYPQTSLRGNAPNAPTH